MAYKPGDMKKKLRVAFNGLDTDNKGQLNESSFFTFLQRIGCNIEDTSSKDIFALIDKRQSGSVALDDAYRYLIHLAKCSLTGFDEKTPPTSSEMQLMSALLRSEKIDFKSFTKSVWKKQKEASLPQLERHLRKGRQETEALLRTLDIQSKKDEESDDDDDDDLCAAGSPNESRSIDDIRNEDVQVDTESLAITLKENLTVADQNNSKDVCPSERKNFKDFKRMTSTGVTVVEQKGDHKMVPEGEHNLFDLTFPKGIEPVTPKHATANVKWIKGEQGQHGNLVFKSSFEGKIPTVLANDAYLSYYGCRLAIHIQNKVNLLFEHELTDFKYSEDYLDNYVVRKNRGGGASLERHEFHHLDCPMEDNSGRLIIGKFVDQDEHELHLTAFVVPPFQSVYIPNNAIHINDYLKGQWRTMLSSEAPIDSVKLVKTSGESTGCDDTVDGMLGEPFEFSFEELKF